MKPWSALVLALGLLAAASHARAHNPGSVEIAELTERLAEAPDDVDLLLRRARLFLSYGDSADTISDLDRILALQPHHAEALRFRADTHYMLEHWEAALDDLDAAIAMGDEEAGTRGLRGKILSVLGRNEEALADLDRALEAREYYVWLADRVRVLEALDRLEDAVVDLERLVALTGGYFGVPDLQRLRMKQGRPDLAARAMDAAVALDPGNGSFRVLRGESRAAAGIEGDQEDFREGLRLLRTTADEEDWDAEYHRLAGRALRGLGRAGEAQAHETKARALDAADAQPPARPPTAGDIAAGPAPAVPPPAVTPKPPAAPRSPLGILRGEWGIPGPSPLRDVLAALAGGCLWALCYGGMRFLVLGAALCWPAGPLRALTGGGLTALGAALWFVTAHANHAVPGANPGTAAQVVSAFSALAGALLLGATSLQIFLGLRRQPAAPAPPTSRGYRALFLFLSGMAIPGALRALPGGGSAGSSAVSATAFLGGVALALCLLAVAGDVLARRVGFLAARGGAAARGAGSLLLLLGATWMILAAVL